MGNLGYLPLGWPFFLCLLEVLVFLGISVFLVRKFESFPTAKTSTSAAQDAASLQKHQVSECCWAGIHPAWLFAFRTLALVYLLPVQLYNLIQDGPRVYLFYTQWTFTLLIIYFALAVWTSIGYLSHTRKDGSHSEIADYEEARSMSMDGDSVAELQPRRTERAGSLGYLMLLVFQVVAPAVLLTDTVYWFILVPFVLRSRAKHGMVDISMHAVNAVLLLGEFFLNSMPFPWFRGSYLVFWTVAYLLVQWALHAARAVSWWPYPFLELDTPWAPLWYFGLALVHLFVFLVCLGLAKAKRAIIH